MAVERYFLAGWTVALAASEACLEVAGVECSCKWPNDLLAGDDGRKLAGVLSEVGEAGALVVGIGLNCALPAVPTGDPVPPELASATSLERLAGTHPLLLTAREDLACKPQIFRCGEIPLDAVQVPDIGHLRGEFLAEVRHLLTPPTDLAAHGARKPAKRAQQSGLTKPVRPSDMQGLTRREVE
jgi:hypothetical protein